MADPPPAPGHDQITLTTPPGACTSREHTRLGVLAQVIITFGELGTPGHTGALWQEAWGKSYPACAECWDAIRQVAQARRPALAITGTPAR